MKVLSIDAIINKDDNYIKYLENNGITVDHITGGEDIQSIVKYTHYDVIILDIILPYIDGMELINIIKANSISSAIIVYSYVSNENIIREAFVNGADYYLIKPADPELLLRRINSFSKENIAIAQKTSEYKGKEFNVEKSIRNLLKELGISSNLKGYKYVVDAINMYIDNEGSFDAGITKSVYPELAKKYHSTPSRIERNIRHTVEKCWSCGSYDKIQEIFGYTVPSNKYKPANSCFIAEVSEYIMSR